jgi:hypothetical protein
MNISAELTILLDINGEQIPLSQLDDEVLLANDFRIELTQPEEAPVSEVFDIGAGI